MKADLMKHVELLEKEKPGWPTVADGAAESVYQYAPQIYGCVLVLKGMNDIGMTNMLLMNGDAELVRRKAYRVTQVVLEMEVERTLKAASKSFAKLEELCKRAEEIYDKREDEWNEE